MGVPAPLGGVATVNGFVGPDPREEVESLLPVPYPLAGDVVFDGSPMSAVPAGALRAVSSKRLLAWLCEP